MTLRFRAAVLSEAGRKLGIETVEAEQPRAGEVLVRIAAAGLCHTDLEVIQGQLVYPMPIVLGHEAAGIIASVGAGVDPGRVGERVVLSWNPHCGRCFHCERGQPILCDKYVSQGARAVAFDGTTRLTLGGQPVQTMMYSCCVRRICCGHQRLCCSDPTRHAARLRLPAGVRRINRRRCRNSDRRIALW